MKLKYEEKIKNNAKEITMGGGSRGGGSKISMSMVNNRNGKRLKLANGLAKKLDEPEEVQIAMLKEDGVIAIGKTLPNINTSFKLSYTNGAIIYNAGLVEQITEAFGLSYDTVTSMTFNNIEFETIDGVTVAIVHINKQ